MPASSPETISQGIVSRLRTGSIKRIANDPANAAFNCYPLAGDTCREQSGQALSPRRCLQSTTSQVVMDKKSSFPSRLASLRKWRGLSQLQLAAAADCSQRHISFLELGRTQPSREMMRRLSVALGLSFRQSNDLLMAAGFAPIWSDTPFDA